MIRRVCWLPLALCVALLSGCPRKAVDLGDARKPERTPAAAAAAAPETLVSDAELAAAEAAGLWDGQGIWQGRAEEGEAGADETFEPPALDELRAAHEWIDLPVVDSRRRLAEWWESQPKPATVEEALALENTGPEANEKILMALGRPPASDAEVDWDASLVYCFPTGLGTTNPILVSSTYDFDYQTLTAANLFAFDWEFTPYADANYVVKWQTSDDRTVDLVTMRRDATWSDGQPLTARDVEFTYRTIMDERVPVTAVRSGTAELKTVKAYDDVTVAYFHKAPRATNPWNVNFDLIPEHVYADSLDDDPTLKQSAKHAELEVRPVTGGPYETVERRINDSILLRRRESWFTRDGKQVRPKPYAREVRLRIIPDTNTRLLALKKGDVEILELSNPSQWRQQAVGKEFYRRNTKVTATEWTYFYFGWNAAEPLFADRRVRQAMGYAFDHEELREKLLFGLYPQASTMFHPDSPMAPEPAPPLLRQDLDRAEELLDAAGWTDANDDGVREKTVDGTTRDFRFTVLCPNSDPLRVKICELLAQNLGRIGIECQVKAMDFPTLVEKTSKHQYEAYLGGWGTGADPDTAKNLWMSDQIATGRNYVAFADKRVDLLFDKAAAEYDRDRRMAMYSEVARRVYDAQPYTFLYNRASFYGFSKAIRGYKTSPRSPFGYSPGFRALWKPTGS